MNKKEQRKIFANNLISLLKINNKTRKNISEDLNIAYSRVCDWSRARTFPTEPELRLLSNYFSTTTEQLIDGSSITNENNLETGIFTKKMKVAVINIDADELHLNDEIDYEWVSIKHLMPEKGYLIFNVVDDLMEPKYSIGDTVMAEFNERKTIKEDGDYLIKFYDYNYKWLFIHIYVKKDGYLVAPLNNNNSKEFLPIFYTKEEFLKNIMESFIAVRVSKNI